MLFFGLALGKMPVKGFHQPFRISILRGPNAGNDASRACIEECLDQTRYSFFAFDAANPGIARRQRNEFSADGRSSDFSCLQQPVLVRPTAARKHEG
jgi:hypothetical protein